MRLRLASLALLLTVGFAAAAPPGDPEDGFVSLFDGKTLNGWKRIAGKKADAFGVENGLLVSHGEGGGWLGTTKPHADFVFKFDFKLSPESNSGIYLRAPDDDSHISRTGMEIQLLDDPHPRYKTIKDWQRTGAIYHVAPPKPGHLKPVGEWNSMEILAQGPHVVIKLNGAVVVDDQIDKHPDLAAEHTGLSRKTGLLGLQSHNGRVEFRNLRIKDL